MTVRSWWIVAGIVVLGLAIALLMPKAPQTEQPSSSTASAASEPKEKPTITDLKPGSGRAAEPGDMVTVQYTLYVNGKKVDSSRDRKQPLRFLLGGGMMVKGWDIGLEGVRVGTVRRLVVPPSLGYGSRGSEDGKIPPNATLTFEVQVLKIEKIEDEPLLDPLVHPEKAKTKSGTNK